MIASFGYLNEGFAVIDHHDFETHEIKYGNPLQIKFALFQRKQRSYQNISDCRKESIYQGDTLGILFWKNSIRE